MSRITYRRLSRAVTIFSPLSLEEHMNKCLERSSCVMMCEEKVGEKYVLIQEKTVCSSTLQQSEIIEVEVMDGHVQFLSSVMP